MITKRSLAVVAVSLFMLGGCGSSSKTSSTTTTTKASGSKSTTAPAGGATKTSGGNTVDIKGFAFSPKALKVSVGTQVTWTNDDSADHTTTSDKGAPASWDSGHLAKGKKFSYTFAKKGTYSYHCDIHNSMTGTVDVS
ncbi:MAG: cupredoxin family copper-binding protein [Actinomycetota bacterium]|nr:cupredoxin family copper-binding protein [Actinomycetota bacterium]